MPAAPVVLGQAGGTVMPEAELCFNSLKKTNLTGSQHVSLSEKRRGALLNTQESTQMGNQLTRDNRSGRHSLWTPRKSLVSQTAKRKTTLRVKGENTVFSFQFSMKRQLILTAK